MKAKKRLSKFDFSGEGAHVALVSVDQGGPANGVNTLVMKSTDVVVELSMAEFLVRFFNMWSGDAEFVANMLGYSDDTEALWDKDKLKEQVTLLSDLKEYMESPEYTESDERFPLDMPDLSDVGQETLRTLTKSLAESSSVKITDLDVIKDADGVSDMPVSENEETPNEVNKSMTTEVEMIEKSAVEALVEKAVGEAMEAKDAEITELKKSLEAFEAEKLEAKKATFVAKAKEFEVLGAEDFEAFGSALMKMAEDESFAPIQEALEKALNIAKNTDAFEEQGHDLETEEVSGVRAALKARGSVK